MSLKNFSSLLLLVREGFCSLSLSLSPPLCFLLDGAILINILVNYSSSNGIRFRLPNISNV